MRPLPTLRQLQFLTALARRRSFSRAAEEALVSQSTLSAAIKELEHILEAELVDRSSRNFALTPTGEDMVRRAQVLLAQAEDMMRAAGPSEPLTGPRHLGLIPTIGPFVLPKAMSLLGRMYPDLSLYLREGLTAQLVADLAAGHIDMALLAFPYDLAGLETRVIAEDRFMLACPATHRLAGRKSISLDDLTAEELLLLEDGHCLRDQALSACKLQSREIASTFGGTSLFTLAHMASSGLGVTLLPEMAVKAGLAKTTGLTVVPFRHSKSHPAPHREIGLVWRKGSGREEDASAMAEILAKAVQA